MSTDKPDNVALFKTDAMKRFNRRFENLTEMSPSKDSILESPYIDILLFDLNFKENEITNLALALFTKHKSQGLSLSLSEIERKVKSAHNSRDMWMGYTFVGENAGGMYYKNSKKEELPISNFVMMPKSKIRVGEEQIHLIYYVQIIGNPKKYQFLLAASDFNDLKTFQLRVAEQLSHTTAYINDCASIMKSLFHRYVTLAEFEEEKDGTSLIGLEVIDDKKYFCTPNGIYGLDGKISNDLVYMGNQQSNKDEVKKLTNLEYNEKKWKKTIAPTFLKNIVYTQEKWAMLSLLGWVGSLPHDYVVRKEAGTGYFPHAHIVGEPGSGKSTIMTLMKQYMGHNDSAPRVFPTAFETSKLLNSSYTIPILLDEYGKRWRTEHTDAMNKVLVEAFTKAPWSRGQSNLSSVYYKFKNPILMGGQIPTSDQALATRLVPINLYKSFQKSEAGKRSFEHLQALQKMPDKNFWVGYNLFCAQFSNEEVLAIFEKYRQHCRKINSDNRVADIHATVMLGLHFMKLLSEHLGIGSEVGITDEDIMELSKHIDGAANATETKDVSPLSDFLRDLAAYAIAIGNSTTSGKYFGTGLSVMPYTPHNDGAGEYGNRDNKTQACIYGRDMILVKIEDMVTVVNNYKKSKTHNTKEIMTFIESDFRRSLDNPKEDSNLVLVPKQYKNRYGRYTGFSKAALIELYSEFDNITWIEK